MTNFVNCIIDKRVWWKTASKAPYVQRILKRLAAIHDTKRQSTLSNNVADVTRHLAYLAQEAAATPGANLEEVANAVVLGERLLERLRGFSYRTALCHGDFHPANIIPDADNVWVIDWLHARRDDPMEELARFCLFLGLGLAESQELFRDYPHNETDQEERFVLRLALVYVLKLLDGIRCPPWPVPMEPIWKFFANDLHHIISEYT
jgi:thiamine kinase-like enzyme